MKRIFSILMTVLFIAGTAIAAKAETEKEEKRLAKETAAFDKEASRPDGEKAVVQSLEKEFKVDETTINNLRKQKLGYGEIAIVLALSDKMGGINDTNINKIMTMRQGPPVEGWGEIAKKLGFKLGHVISNVERARKESHSEIEKEERGKKEGRERMEKPGKIERHERPERHRR
ncbi:MAG: hypothetical protein HY026_02755 [Deltaproteobacteria bacterium]|nr:hypothetical protein [Deltaproteobacteria bacterium]